MMGATALAHRCVEGRLGRGGHEVRTVAPRDGSVVRRRELALGGDGAKDRKLAEILRVVSHTSAVVAPLPLARGRIWSHDEACCLLLGRQENRRNVWNGPLLVQLEDGMGKEQRGSN